MDADTAALLHQLIEQQNTQHTEMMRVLRDLPTKEDLAEVKAEVHEHDQFINGNGTPGAKTKLALVEEKVNAMLLRFDKLSSDVAKDALAKLVQLVGVPLLLGAIAWAAKVLLEK
jgi:hypothetical protein